MSGQASEIELNVGVYGRTQAGKTHFLHALLMNWKTCGRIAFMSASCERFLESTSHQISEHGKTSPTSLSTKIEPIWLNVRRPDSDDVFRYEFYDLRGEKLEEEIDQLQSLPRSGWIPEQVQKCQAFLFFFEPASWERPEFIDKHHESELTRAEKFVDRVLDDRQNQYLPIIFVITRRDQWQDDPELRLKAEKWSEKVHSVVANKYRERLAGHFPPCLLEKELMIVQSSAMHPADVELVIENASRLVELCSKFRGQHRARVMPTIMGASAVLIALFIVLTVFLLMGSEDATKPGNGDAIVITAQTESEILARSNGIAKRIEFLKSQDIAVDQASDLNSDLQWLVQTRSYFVDGKPLKEGTIGAMDQVLSASGDLIRKSENRADVLAIWSAYLKGLPDLSGQSETLGNIQREELWRYFESAIADELGSVIKRRMELNSSPEDCLTELVERLKQLERDVRLKDIFGPAGKRQLLEQVEKCTTFCETLLDKKSVNASVAIESARQTAESDLKLHVHAIAIGTAPSLSLKPLPSLDMKNVVLYRTASPSFDLSIDLADAVRCRLSKFMDDKWDDVFLVTLKTEDSPLKAIGLPLISKQYPEPIVEIDKGGYEIKLKFSNFPPVPKLIWSAVEPLPR
jgi:hypothetical protein